MRKLFVISHRSSVICLLSLLFVMGLFILSVTQVSAQVTINTNIPGITSQTGNNGVCNFVFAFYNYALMISGVLAFAAITYGGIKYTFAAGNPSGQSEGKEWVKGAVLGLLLLIGAYLILNVVNPDLTTCGLPILQSAQTNVQPVTTPPSATSTYNCTPSGGGLGYCNSSNNSCSWSQSLGTAVACINASPIGNIQKTTTGSQHICNPPTSVSCHFGGTSCSDGGHAFDLGKKELATNSFRSFTLSQALPIAQGCASSCYCESGTSRVDCTDPTADHIHCNVNNRSCGCN